MILGSLFSTAFVASNEKLLCGFVVVAFGSCGGSGVVEVQIWSFLLKYEPMELVLRLRGVLLRLLDVVIF